MYNLGKHNTTSDKNHQSAREQIKPTWLQLPSAGRYRHSYYDAA